MSSYENPKYNLKTHSGLSNYRSHLEQHLVPMVSYPQVSNEAWLNMLANILNSWFRAEHLMLTPDSPTLLEFMKWQDKNIIEVHRTWHNQSTN